VTGERASEAEELLARRQDEYFAQRSASWTDRYRKSESFRARLSVVGTAILKALEARPGARVLDFGGGTGVFSRLAATRAEVVVCVDRSLPMLRRGLDDRTCADVDAPWLRPGAVRGRVLRVAGDEAAIPPFPCFDLVLAIAVLEYVEDCTSVLSRFAQVIRPKGRVLLTVPDPRSPVRALEQVAACGVRWMSRRRSTDRSYWPLRPHGNRTQWRAAAQAAGFRIGALRPIPLGLSPLRRSLHPSLLVELQTDEGRRRS